MEAISKETFEDLISRLDNMKIRLHADAIVRLGQGDMKRYGDYIEKDQHLLEAAKNICIGVMHSLYKSNE